MSENTESPLGPVSEILLDWEERRQRGETVGVEELCRNQPELSDEVARRIRILESVYRVPNQATVTKDGDSTDGDLSEVLPHVPGYDVLGQLGRGGMGVVYKVRHQRLHRVCALKMLRYDGPTGPAERARFRTEAEAVAALQHPNIVQLYEVGEVERSPFLVLEYVDGTTLAERIRSGPIPTKDAAELVRTLAEAVEYAHGRGIIHRDLKPGNILLSFSRRSRSGADATETISSTPLRERRLNEATVKITDFGLAKRLPGAESVATNGPHTATGAVFGTPAYMAPEQALGHTRDIGPAADVYSLGAILYELLTGRPPFQAESVLELLSQVRSMEPVSPRRLRPQLPGDLDTICLKCLQKEPAKRYAGAAALADDLRRYLSGQPIRARRVAMSERAWRWCRRNPVVAGLTGMVAATLVIGTLVASALAVWALGERNRARLELGNSLAAQGAALQGRGQMGHRFESLRLLGEAARELRNHPQGMDRIPDIRNHAISALGLTDVRVSMQRHIGRTVRVQFDHRLERYATVDYVKPGHTRIRRVDNDQQLLELPHPGTGFWHAKTDFSADGQYLIAYYWPGEDENIVMHVWDIARSKRIFAHRIAGENVWPMANVYSNAPRLAFVSPAKELVIWDMAEQRELRRFGVPATPVNMCVDPAGERVALADTDGETIRILDLETGRELARWRVPTGVAGMAWSADGQLLACGSGDGRVSVWHTPGGDLVSVLRGHTTAVLHLQFAHTGHLLATTGWDRTTRLWDPIAGETLVSAPGVFTRFSTDDRQLAFHDGTGIGIWDVEHGQECRTLHPGFRGSMAEWKSGLVSHGPSFSSDGRLLATGDRTGVRLWDVANGEQRAHIASGLSHPTLFHPDGQSMITHSPQGTYCWPIRSQLGRAADTFTIGPPELLPIIPAAGSDWQDAKWLPSQRGLVVNDRNNSQVLAYDLSSRDQKPRDPIVLKSKHDRVTGISVSPDGQWVAAGGWKVNDVQLWNLRERRLARLLPPGEVLSDEVFWPYFSPDGRWLVIATGDEEGSDHGYHFRRTETWERERFLPATLCFPSVAFTGDGQVVAMSVTPQQILLASPADGHEIARLSTLQPIGPRPSAFSSDGSKLAALTARQTVMIWDLRRIRERLAEMGLDWDAPSFAETGPNSTDKPLRVQIVGEVPKPATQDP